MRELENVIRKIIILGDEEAVLPEVLGNNKKKEARAHNDHDDGEEYSLREIGRKAAIQAEREAIENVLKRTRWNRSRAAKILKVSYKTLLHKIKETGLET